eukprot:Platyproteum_vivax@DN2462_c0_g1_i1.p1
MLQSVPEKAFILEALKQDIRLDGRGCLSPRVVKISLLPNANGVAEVCFGKTRVVCCTAADVVTPYPDRPSEGFVSFNVELSTISGPHFEGGQYKEVAVDIALLIESLLKEARAIDTETLCIVSGKKVWSLRVDIQTLDDFGNLYDACALAALASLLHFRKPEVSYEGQDAKVHSTEEREPLPLSVYHLPILVSIAIFKNDDNQTLMLALDPTSEEVACSCGVVSIGSNQHGQVCCVHKTGGIGINFEVLDTCMTAATEVAQLLCLQLQEVVANSKEEALLRKKRLQNVYGKSTIEVQDWNFSIPIKERVHDSQPLPPPITAPTVSRYEEKMEEKMEESDTEMHHPSEAGLESTPQIEIDTAGPSFSNPSSPKLHQELYSLTLKNNSESPDMNFDDDLASAVKTKIKTKGKNKKRKKKKKKKKKKYSALI